MTELMVQEALPIAFADAMRTVALSDLFPLKPVSDAVRRTRKYSQIKASVREIGMVEPLVVTPKKTEKGKFIVLDGHLRLSVETVRITEQMKAVKR